MLDQHDHHRIDAREMLGRAASAGSRPAAANDVGCVPAIGAETMARMPPGEAQGRRRTHGASSCVELRDQREHAERHRRRICQWRKSAALRRRNQGRAQASQTSCHTSVPVSSIAGRPSLHGSSRASSRFASSASVSGAARRASARSRPGPEKKVSGRMLLLRKRDLRGAAIEGRKPGASATRSSGCHQPSPTGSDAGTTCRSSEKWVKTWRTVPIDVDDLGRRHRVQSLPGSAAIPPSMPFGGPAHQPDLRRRARSNRRRRVGAAAAARASEPGKASGVPLANAAQWRCKRALAAARRFGPADGRAEVHHRLGEIAGAVRRASCRGRGVRPGPLEGSLRARAAARSRARHWCRPPPPSRRTRSRRSPPRYRRRCPGSWRSSAAVVRESRRVAPLRGRRRSGCARGRNSRGRPIRRGSSSSLAAASASIVGQRATNRSNRGVTAATVVCWSITSLSHTR